MKTLYLVRHAKSSWSENVQDHQRPLNKRGLSDMVMVSEHIVTHFPIPERIISSDANRALTTAKQFQKAYQLPERDFFTEAQLYDFSGGRLLNVIKNCDDNINRLMLFGHNYALTVIANELGDTYIENIPTCGFVQINFEETQWKNCEKGKTIATVFPKDLK